MAISFIGGGNRSTRRKPDLPQVTDKPYCIMLYRVHLSWAEFELATLGVIATDSIDNVLKHNQWTWINLNRKNSKISKIYTEAANRRTTDNTLAKGKGQKDEQLSTKHYTENWILSDTDPLNTGMSRKCHIVILTIALTTFLFCIATAVVRYSAINIIIH